MSMVFRHISDGWPKSPIEELRPYWTKRLELTFAGCILWSGRVVVPPQGWKKVLHGGHPRVSRMKALSRSLVWWPGLDSDIEKPVKACASCQQSQPSLAVAPLHPWQWPTRPWSRLLINYAGPMDKKMFPLVINAHSKWIEVFPMSNATALSTVQHLRQLFAWFRIPDSIVSDNGTLFTAQEFQDFCKSNRIQHIRSSPYHPSSNGLVERAVQVFKQGMKKASSGTVSDKASRLLFHYRITPHTITGLTPSEMLIGRTLHSTLDLLKPDVRQRVIQKQSKQKLNHDKHCKSQIFPEGERVLAKNLGQGKKWLPGKIVSQKGPVTFEIELEDGRSCQPHQDHVRKRSEEEQSVLLHEASEREIVWQTSEGPDSESEQMDERDSPEPESEPDRYWQQWELPIPQSC